MYLVMIRCSIDELPVRVFTHHVDAIEYVETNLHTEEQVNAVARDIAARVFNMDPSETVNVALVTFNGMGYAIGSTPYNFVDNPLSEPIGWGKR